MNIITSFFVLFLCNSYYNIGLVQEYNAYTTNLPDSTFRNFAYFYVDSSNNLTVKDITHINENHFKPLDSLPKKRSPDYTYWAKFKITNTDSTNYKDRRCEVQRQDKDWRWVRRFRKYK
jgi:hypothetical protein